VLVQRAKGAHLASLANGVVWIWLWWGDAYVPFRQVPRSLIPWRAAEQEPAEVHVRKAAREAVSKVAHPRGSGKRRLANALVQMTYDRDPDPEQLREPFDDLFDPDRTGAERGPAGAQLSTDRYLAMVAMRVRTLGALETFTEAEYRSARALYQHSRREYATEQPRYATDPSLGRMFEVPDDNEVFNSACHDLVTCLGIIREHTSRPNRAQRRSARRGGTASGST
jgi:glycine/D-amino acid oxidase-like deaminating enzyme